MTIKDNLRDLVYKTTAKYAPRVHSAIVAQRRPDAEVDSRVSYPSYKSMDDHIDVERLKAMDGTFREAVERFLHDEETPLLFNTGELKMKAVAPRHPGGRMIQLSEPVRPVKYHELRDCNLWKPGAAAEHFPEMMDFIAGLPFEDTARLAIMCDLEGRAVSAHRDHYASEMLHEFIWFRTNFDKPFFVQSWQTKEKKLFESYSAWFDTVNQYHGSDPAKGFCISLRVDGRFTEEFRARIPKPPINLASTPSYWAAVEG